MGIDPLVEEIEVHRLCDIVIGPGTHGLDDALAIVFSRGYDHRELPESVGSAQGCQYPQPVQTGHHQIEDQEIHPTQLDAVHRTLTGFCLDTPVALGLQALGYEKADSVVIVHHQNGWGHRRVTHSPCLVALPWAWVNRPSGKRYPNARDSDKLSA